MNQLPISREEISEIISTLDFKIAWIGQYASHSPASLQEAERLKQLVKKLERVYDEFTS